MYQLKITMRTKENTNLRKNLLIYVDQIKQDYLDGIKTSKIAEKYKVSEATMRRFFKENGISLNRRNLKDPEVIKKLRSEIEELLPSNTITNICKILGINHTKYAEIMSIESKAKEFCNEIKEEFVDMDSKYFCYFLGIFMADGSFDKQHIRLYQSDSDFLHKLQNLMNHRGVLRKDSRSANVNYCVDIVSPSLRNLLEKLKVDSNKKFTAPFINCGKFQKDFVRGVFDGDGCLSYTYTSGKFKDVVFDITSGSIAMIQGISSFLSDNNIEHSVVETSKMNTYYSIRINSLMTIIRVLDLLYTDSGEARLDRKYINFVKFKQLVNMNQKINDIVETNLKELDKLRLT